MAEPQIAITGATGLIGSRLRASFEDEGASTLTITRNRDVGSLQELYWDPAEGFLTPERLNGLEAVVHLAGENIAGGRWTEEKKRRILHSREQGTATLSQALAGLERKPQTLICASAVGYYGDRGDELLDEQSPPGETFLAEVCTRWEAAAQPAREAGIRVVHVRIGMVLSRDGGALQKMLTPFRFGAGGRVGSGRQWWSWVHISDVVAIMRHCLQAAELSGPVNATSPNPVTNAEFTKVLGRVLHRPTMIPVPRPLAKLALGEMADELLLPSARVLPKRLQENGYDFRFAQLEDALREELGGAR